MKNAREVYEELRRSRIHFQGREREVTLSVTTTDHLSVIGRDLEVEEEQLAGLLRTEVFAWIDTLDGEEPDYETMVAIATDTRALGEFLAARNRLAGGLREQGELFAQCPHCREHEANLSLMALVAGLRAPMWPLTRPDGMFMAVPSLATPWRAGKRRSGMPLASRLRFELPAHRAGLEAPTPGGVLRALSLAFADNDDPQIVAWKRWAPEGVKQPEERSWWRAQVPGFCAVLGLTVACASLEGIAEPTPEVIEQMPLVDFLFLDALYHLVRNVDVPETTSLHLTCPRCQGRFLPLLSGELP